MPWDAERRASRATYGTLIVEGGAALRRGGLGELCTRTDVDG